MRTKLGIAAGAALLSLLAAACGGSSSSNTTAAGTTGAASSAGAGTAATPAGTEAAPSATGTAATGTAGQAAAPATEASPVGDIPDTQAFVPVTPPGQGYTVQVPEGWARRAAGGAVIYSDKLNSVRLESAPLAGALTPASVRAKDVPALRAASKGFTLVNVTPVTRKAGGGVLIKYAVDSPPDPVTGRVFRDDVERYLFAHKGREAILTLTAPKGSDNVDPWRKITDSLTWRA